MASNKNIYIAPHVARVAEDRYRTIFDLTIGTVYALNKKLSNEHDAVIEI